ncbi:MAG: hypothetical protein L0Z55_12110 [Planctomycetes bacterium]|nr:hypothetical protein [Planctomycetota bacterium]
MQGEVIYLYAFDVANEIATEALRGELSGPAFPFEIRTDHTYPKDVPIYRPLAFEPHCTARLFGRPIRIVIRIFDVGVINVAMRVPFEVSTLRELYPYHGARADDGPPLDEMARTLCADLCETIKRHMVRSSPSAMPEAYTVFYLSDLDAEIDANAWFRRERRAVAGLLTETDPALLSPDQVDEALRINRSFQIRDLVVIDWDASVVVDLDGYADDVLYVLELANLQLEEFRVMDRRLDVHVDRAYRDLAVPHKVFGPPAQMLHWLRSFRVDLTKLADEVSHITKFLGDWHLARVYLGAQERFHLQQWSDSVEKRLLHLDQAYQVLQAETYERRMLWLEIAVVICFLVDLLAIFLWKR